ncbi:MAG: alpha-amylase family protein [Bacteroidales bacterium]
MKSESKPVIYQIMVRLAGNTSTAGIPYGTYEQNGCGKFNDLSPVFLKSIQQLGATHIWLTGILEHATCTDYSLHDIPAGNPLVIKGRAGSPYAITDYYDVDPDLAVDVARRMEEFESLVQRCHQQGLAPIIDFVPNHVARQYASDSKPDQAEDFGFQDDCSKAFVPSNNFYYIPGKKLRLPEEVYQLPYVKDSVVNPYEEHPARATGNDQFHETLNYHDWYETVKLNYGIDYLNGGRRHFDPIPDTWHKMRDILLFWASKKISGFRCDMAEMVPVEFWEWVIPQVKKAFPGVIFIAEIYNPDAYRNFIFKGRFDYLYDKMGLYDTLRAVVEQRLPATSITGTWKQLEGIGQHMLRFMENHDEQRIASSHFAGTPLAGIPAMTISATIHQGPVMLYCGQETGEPAQGAAGYSGDDGRTTIFDYDRIPTFQQWFNHGLCDGGLLNSQQHQLRNFYSQLLESCRHPVITSGHFYDLMWANNPDSGFNDQHCYTFLRWDQQDVWLVMGSFNPRNTLSLRVTIPEHFIRIRNAHPLAHKKVVPVLMGLHPDTALQQVSDSSLQVTIGPFDALILALQ